MLPHTYDKCVYKQVLIFKFLVNKKFIFCYIRVDTLQKVQISSVVSRNTNGKSS